MTIVYLGNFYGIDFNATGNASTDAVINSPYFTFYGKRVGRHDTIDNKSVLRAQASTAVGGNYSFGKTFSKELHPVGTKIIAGYRVKWSDTYNTTTPTRTATIITGLPIPATVLLYRDVVYSVELEYTVVSHTATATAITGSTTYVFKIYINKELVYTNNALVINRGVTSPTYSFSGSQAMGSQWLIDFTDLYIVVDKPDDLTKTGLIGPLDIRHYSPTTAIGADNWTIVDGSAQSVLKTGVTVLQALADNEVGTTDQAAMTVAMTDPSGSVAKFKFDNVPLGDYLAYSVDMYANQPQSQSGDLETEVFLLGETIPIASKLVSGVIKDPGKFELVNAITNTNPITGAELRVMEVAIGSKRIVPI